MKHFVNSGQSHKHAFLQSNFVLLSLRARDKLTHSPVSPLGPPLSWREFATTRGCPDNPHTPTADHNYNLYTRDTVTHKDIYSNGPIITYIFVGILDCRNIGVSENWSVGIVGS